MKTGIKGLDLIKKYEGFRAKPYLCPAGVPTIGYGSTRYEDGRAVKLSDAPITIERATALLTNTLKQYEDAVNKNIKVPLNQNQFDALTGFTYNVGIGAIQNSTLTRRLNMGDYQRAADELLRWNRSKGKALAGLTRRREEERRLFLS